MGIGKAIEYYRKKRNLTTTELAESLGLSQSTISLYEKGSRNVSDEMVERISEVLNVSKEELIEKAMSFDEQSPENTYSKAKMLRRLERTADILIRLSDNVLIIGDVKVVDLNSRTGTSHKKVPVIESVLTKVVSDIITENRDEINDRALKELKDTENLLRKLGK